MRFQVPQFTDVEDKVIGPLTFKQFVYLAGAVGACVAIYSFLPLFLALPAMLVVALFGITLAFYKVNNRPFIHMVESFLNFSMKSKLYIWKHERKPISKIAADAKKSRPSMYVPKLSESKLRDLTWSLDVKENLNPVTREEGEV